jgi:hypothetical protein
MNTVRKQAEEQKDVKNIRQRPELAGKLLGPTSTTTAATEASEMKDPGSGLAAKRSEPRPHLFQPVRFARGLIGPDVVLFGGTLLAYLGTWSWHRAGAKILLFQPSHTKFRDYFKNFGN